MSWSYLADLPCTYLAEHEPESANSVVAVTLCRWLQSVAML